MKIISFIEDDSTIKKILKHCGKWKEAIPRPPPQRIVDPEIVVEEVTLDNNFTFGKLSACFDQNCI